MKEPFFKTKDGIPMGRMVLADDCACVMTVMDPDGCAHGWACGFVDKLACCVANCGVVAMEDMNNSEKFATLMMLGSDLNEKKILSDKLQIKVFLNGREVPFKAEDLALKALTDMLEALEELNKGDKDESI